jgi:serine-type D-Ala-D-Ala carboxypeptidase/endopeptidase (penicillin-binding protein 4)
VASAPGKKLISMHINSFFSILASSFLLLSCSTQKQLGRTAAKFLYKDSSLVEAHVGIAIHDPASGKYLYRFQSDKRFTPASNTKILTCYAAMKYLPAQLPAGIAVDLDTAMLIHPTGDPSFLHPDFGSHPFFDYLRSVNKPLLINGSTMKSSALGFGWSWNDYSAYYMTERSAFPVYGNQIHWYQQKSTKENPGYPADSIDLFIYSNPEIDWPVQFGKAGNSFVVEREWRSNGFTLHEGKERKAAVSIPYITNGLQTGLGLLKDSLHKSIRLAEEKTISIAASKQGTTLYSQPTDSLLKLMMHRSDNFFADQSLLMVSHTASGILDEERIIGKLLSTDLSGMPQPARWVDGSGLSRYNQFSPEDMVYVLNTLKAEQDWQRITTIFPKAGTGTLSSFKAKEGDFIYAKSGSMSGVLCLSGYVYSKKGKWLTFSIMINNHNASGALLRKKIEAFLEQLNGTAQ